MIKILHSADWHLDSPMLQRSESQTRLLRSAMASIPGKLAAACRQEQCDLVLLSGDLFDGPYAADSLQQLQQALEEMAVPVFISPGNHDFISPDSPWLRTEWPENVHIFTHPAMEAVDVPELDLCVYGAGFTQMDCPGLLQDFSPTHTERYGVAVLHGDPTQTASPYCPITAQQVEASGLHLLALGHIHKAGSFRAGKTLCTWPGCPMGRGYDEQGEKGYYIITLDQTAEARFVPLDTPRFYDLEVAAEQPLSGILPPVATDDFYRITLTGAAQKPDLEALRERFSHLPNLELRDKTVPPTDVWGSAGEDTFEGIFFKLLQEALETADEAEQSRIRLAARISRQLLDGQEVSLP